MSKNKLLTALLSLFFSSHVLAGYANTLLVLDMPNTKVLPKNFRTSSDALPANQTINIKGFTELHIAGGAQFSAQALEAILERLNSKRMTVIDLRQESHGFLNDNAVSWYAPQDSGNAGKTSAQVEASQAKRLAKLAGSDEASVYVILSKSSDDAINEAKEYIWVVRGVYSEADLINKLHHHYKRLYVQDYHAPTAHQVDRFINIVKKLAPNEWVYFHCRAGVGRTTTFMVLFDMMHNAKKVSFEDIIARQAAIGGKDLTELPSTQKWKYKYAVERLEFLRQFYHYARENDDGFATSWSEWLRSTSFQKQSMGQD